MPCVSIMTFGTYAALIGDWRHGTAATVKKLLKAAIHAALVWDMTFTDGTSTVWTLGLFAVWFTDRVGGNQSIADVDTGTEGTSFGLTSDVSTAGGGFSSTG